MNSIFKGKSLLKGIGYLVLYLILPMLISIPFNFIQKILPNHSIINTIFDLIPYIITLIIFIIIFKNTLLNNIKELNKKTILIGISYWLIGIIIMLVSSSIINYLNVPLPLNEELNREYLTTKLIFQIITSVVITPTIEEIIFRLSTKDLSTNKHIYAITTGLIFAIIHLPDAFTQPIMLLHIIPISAVGIALGYAYKKTNNILSTIIPHSLHNLISILKLIIIGG